MEIERKITLTHRYRCFVGAVMFVDSLSFRLHFGSIGYSVTLAVFDFWAYKPGEMYALLGLHIDGAHLLKCASHSTIDRNK